MLDYKKLELKSGLEIHQQLDTGKLFCRCPSYLRKDEPHFTIRRKLHAVPGETGEVDVAAQYEASLKKEFIYESYNDTNCLIELDEEPPKEINQESLKVALQIALLLNCEIYPVVQIMRKMVIDGSNTSGFQRTMYIGHNGFIETSFGKVEIETVALEEDSARLVSEKKEKQPIFRLDRLGIPLVEISTAPNMNTQDQIKEAALKLGEILRACKVKRGIGTIRQDVNVSIKKYEKVEIKGFQDARIMIETVDEEIKRQIENVAKGKIKGEVRNALPDGKTEFLRPLPGKARMYPETDLPLLKISRDKINEIKKVLPKLKADIKLELKKQGLTDELINLVLENHETLDEFETLMKVYDKDANLVAKMTTLWRTDKEKITERILEEILEELVKKQIEKEDVKDIIKKIENGASFNEAIKVEKVSHDELEEEISKIVKEKPGLRPNAYMGLVMQKMKGKLDAKKAMEIIEKIIKN